MNASDVPCLYELVCYEKCRACGDEFSYIEDVIRPCLCDECLLNEGKNNENLDFWANVYLIDKEELIREES